MLNAELKDRKYPYGKWTKRLLLHEIRFGKSKLTIRSILWNLSDYRGDKVCGGCWRQEFHIIGRVSRGYNFPTQFLFSRPNESNPGSDGGWQMAKGEGEKEKELALIEGLGGSRAAQPIFVHCGTFHRVLNWTELDSTVEDTMGGMNKYNRQTPVQTDTGSSGRSMWMRNPFDNTPPQPPRSIVSLPIQLLYALFSSYPLSASFCTPTASAVPALPHLFILYLPLLHSFVPISPRKSYPIEPLCTFVHAKNHEGIRSRFALPVADDTYYIASLVLGYSVLTLDECYMLTREELWKGEWLRMVKSWAVL